MNARRKLLVAVSTEGDAMHREVAEHCAALADAYEIMALVPRVERERYAASGTRVQTWRPLGFIGMALALRRLRRTVAAFAPDLVHVHGFAAAAVALGTFPAPLAARTIVTLHDPQRDKEIPQRLVDRRFPAYVARAAALVATYPSLARRLETRFALAPHVLQVVPHGVAVPAPGAPLARPPARRGPIVGWRGRLNADRAWETALEALVALREQLPDARLEIAGTGRAYQFVAAEVRARKLAEAVTFRGDVTAGAFLGGIDVLVVPVSRDAQPHALLEALVAGVPVVAARAGALADALEAVETGWLVDDDGPGFAGGVAQAWSRIDDAWVGAAEQRGTAGETYAREIVTGRYRALYEPALDAVPEGAQPARFASTPSWQRGREELPGVRRRR